jgi:hypothetical protein
MQEIGVVKSIDGVIAKVIVERKSGWALGVKSFFRTKI